MIRETYASLIRQPTWAGYWPETVEQLGTTQENRKVLGAGRAPITWRPNEAPRFLWWDFQCELGYDQSPSSAVASFAPYLERHAAPLAVGLSRSLGLPAEVLQVIRSRWGTVLQRLATDGISEAREFLLDWIGLGGIPGLEPLFRAMTGTAAWLHERRIRMSRRVSDIVVDVNTSDPASGIARAIVSMTGGKLPAIVAIEDLHWMGPDTGMLLGRLAEIKADVTVLATAWPEGVGRRHYRDFLGTAGTSVERLSLREPSALEAARIVQAVAPSTARTDAQMIAQHWANPLAMLSLLSLPKVQRRIAAQNGRAKWDPEMTAFPRTPVELAMLRLREMPPSAEGALVWSAGALPLDRKSSAVTFLPELVCELSREIGKEPATPAAAPEPVFNEGMRRARMDYHWLWDPAPYTSRFAEPHLLAAARERWTEEVDDSVQSMIRSVACDLLAKFINARRDGALLVSLDQADFVAAARWLIALAGEVDG
ncbi:MAG: hypothetical protein H6525_04970 [Actinobacteria bacterium]|nr:hypothetical protein [Actinomycetota bacterium]